MRAASWDRLVRLADTAVERALRELPDDLRTLAETVPVSYEPVPNLDIIEEMGDADLLGLFVGEDFSERGSGHDPLPSQILLFLENIWGYANRHEATYAIEVRRTYLHELGHYLGWDEDDLAQRDLD